MTRNHYHRHIIGLNFYLLGYKLNFTALHGQFGIRFYLYN